MHHTSRLQAKVDPIEALSLRLSQVEAVLLGKGPAAAEPGTEPRVVAKEETTVGCEAVTNCSDDFKAKNGMSNNVMPQKSGCEAVTVDCSAVFTTKEKINVASNNVMPQKLDCVAVTDDCSANCTAQAKSSCSAMPQTIGGETMAELEDFKNVLVKGYGAEGEARATAQGSIDAFEKGKEALVSIIARLEQKGAAVPTRRMKSKGPIVDKDVVRSPGLGNPGPVNLVPRENVLKKKAKRDRVATGRALHETPGEQSG